MLRRTESIQALVSDHVYPVGTQDSVMHTHLVYRQTSLEEEDTLAAAAGDTDLTRWTLECYAEEYSPAKILAHRVREVFRRLRERPKQLATWYVARVEDERDVDIVRYIESSKRGLYQVDVDITIRYNPSAVE